MAKNKHLTMKRKTEPIELESIMLTGQITVLPGKNQKLIQKGGVFEIWDYSKKDFPARLKRYTSKNVLWATLKE